MKVRTYILTAGAIVALAAPAAASARSLPVKNKTKLTHVTKPLYTHRVLCICDPNPIITAVVTPSQDELNAAYDADLVAHGLDPVYSTTASSDASAS